jgi:hypothetical protein
MGSGLHQIIKEHFLGEHTQMQTISRPRLLCPIGIPEPYPSIYPIVDSIGEACVHTLHSAKDYYLSKIGLEGFAEIPMQSHIKQNSQIPVKPNTTKEVISLLTKALSENKGILRLLREMRKIYEIDEVNILCSTTGVNNGSDFWHRDGVGHRIKLFIPIAIEGTPPPTDVFRGSHLESCHPRQWELLRVNQENPNNHDHQNQIQDLFCNVYGPPHTIEWDLRMAIALDTNSIHRAGNFTISCDGSTRIFFSIELMQKLQSYAASKYKIGNCNSRMNLKLIHALENCLANA